MASIEQLGIRREGLYARIEAVLQTIADRAGTGPAPQMHVQMDYVPPVEQRELVDNLARVQRICDFLEESMAAFPEKKIRKPA